MKETDFDFHSAIISGKPGRLWWIIAAAMILGALIGLGLSYLFSPVYEAVFKVTTNVKLSGDPNITEFMMDNSILHVGELAYATPVVTEVIEEEKKQGIDLTPEELHRISSVERQSTSTLLKVQWSDAQTAAQIANTWGKIFYASLQEGFKQAVLADELSQYQVTLQQCLAGAQAATASPSTCGFSKTELDAEIAQNAEKISQAESQSLGLYRELNVSDYQEASVQIAPIRYERGWLIAAGTAIGFVAGLLIIEIIISSKKNSSPQ